MHSHQKASLYKSTYLYLESEPSQQSATGQGSYAASIRYSSHPSPLELSLNQPSGKTSHPPTSTLPASKSRYYEVSDPRSPCTPGSIISTESTTSSSSCLPPIESRALPSTHQQAYDQHSTQTTQYAQPQQQQQLYSNLSAKESSNSHCSRSSISSSSTYAFSPSFDGGEESPTTPPSLATPHLQSQQRPETTYSPREKRRPASKHTMATTPIPPMQPSYISQLASYLAEMVVYLWFTPPRQGQRAPTFPKPAIGFTRFCNDVLMTTQVSQSVVVLALLFIWKLQGKHAIDAKPGSEYKLTVTALMLANKILDDHTYTNKTWSEVSGLPLQALNEGEIEFLQGLDFSLYVSQTTYNAWLELLERPDVKKKPNARKKARLATAGFPAGLTMPPPSAPVSPTTHGHSISGVDYGFPLVGSLADSRRNALTVSSLGPVVTANHISQNLLPSQQPHVLQQQQFCLQPPPLQHTRSSPYFNTCAPPPPAPPNADYMRNSLTQSTSRKRRASDDLLLEDRRPSSAHARLRVWNSQDAMMMSTSSNNTSPTYRSHVSTTETPNVHPSVFAAIESMSEYSTKGSEPASQDGGLASDFTTLASSFTPVGDVFARDPGNLAYYALAAGQSRGGYLSYQPARQPRLLQPPQRVIANMPTRSTDATLQARPPHALVSESMAYSQSADGQVRTSQSLSPSDYRVGQQDVAIRQHPQRYPHDKQQQRQMQQQTQQSLVPQAASRLHPSPVHHLAPPSAPAATVQLRPHSTRSSPVAYYNGAAGPGVSPSVALRASSRALGANGVSLGNGLVSLHLDPLMNPLRGTHGSAVQPPPNPPLAQLPSYYSSFSNNGLPGVPYWSNEGYARYAAPAALLSTAPPVTWGWPQRFA